jgi:hypothetical protein
MTKMRITLGVFCLVLGLAGNGFAQEATPELQSAMEDLGLPTETALPPTGDVYIVARGDTLWDICQVFFGDPEAWPGLWSINNEEITNPHYIFPGQVLRLQAGSDIRPPSLVAGAAVAPRLDAPFEEFQPKSKLFAATSDCSVHVPFSRRLAADVTLSAPEFISRTKIEPLGTVEKAVPGSDFLSKNHIVYMKFDKTTDVDCGRIYSLYRSNKKVTHPRADGAPLGHSYAVTAEVLITDVGEKWVTGRIVQSFSEVERGELITDRIPVSGTVRTAELTDEIDGYIVSRALDENLLVQKNQVVFIDRGRKDGLRSGSIMWVVRRGDGLNMKPKLSDRTLPDQVVGRLVVFSADDHVSTAVMVDQSVAVQVGDRITSRID